MTLAAAWCAVGLGAAVLAHRWRHRALRLCVLVVGVAAALALTVAVTGEVAPDLFATAAKISVATVVLSIVAVLLLVRTLPQLVSRNDRHSVVVVFAAVAAMYLAVGAFLAAAAHDGSQVQDLPQLRTRDEFIDRRDSPGPPGAVLLEARISAATAESASGVAASYRCPTIGWLRLPATRDQLPSRYLLELPGGPPIVAGPIAPDQAWAWPSVDGECVLRRGDPVVVWGELQGGMGAGGPTSYTGLANVQMIAVGDIRSFLHDFGPVAERTGRAVTAAAALNAVLAAVMVGVGVRAFRRLSRFGTDTPPRITWRSASR
ncbi:hypothetical protein [Mycolicibacterium hippocampi]|uniref:Uncharacterized protein n=1 Tax=Mycolicibacterium hippocampi TaxID=659824 RepID=A0A7I9ZMX8_9MYCO|nr:hypothetical protein [Mycolicibacterium hippocampi]GFH02008.1 hypothetical protein MHIP_24910 [Mycolicibacterium hippocampi]